MGDNMRLRFWKGHLLQFREQLGERQDRCKADSWEMIAEVDSSQQVMLAQSGVLAGALGDGERELL